MKKITTKIVALAFGFSLFIGIILSIMLYSSLLKTNNRNLNLLEKNMREEFDLNAKNEVQVVYSLVNAVNTLPITDKFSVEEKQKLTADLVRELRYGIEGYFWIDSKEGDNIVLLGKEAEGKNRYNQQDSDGNHFIQDIINNGYKDGGGYSNYSFPKKGSDVPMPKRSYSLAFKPYDWVIGTGNYIDDIDTNIAKYKTEANNALQKTLLTSIAIIITLLILSFIVAYSISKRLSNPIVEISDKMREISEGNLKVYINIKQQDEVGLLANAVNQMVIKLREIIDKISTSSSEIMNASGQMSDSSQQLSQGANEQAASTEEVSSSMEEMASNIQQNMFNAKEAEKISLQSTNGIQKVSKHSIDSLEATRRISAKISIINDIASQTNILALNAAVEAARAGEHGKGFAVVAGEVRKLAEKSADAAEEIVTLAKSSLRIAEEMQEILNNVLPEIEKTKLLVQEISAASDEQSNGASQVNSAIQQLNSITQQNAAASEELASSSEELSSQSENLNYILGYFKME